MKKLMFAVAMAAAMTASADWSIIGVTLAEGADVKAFDGAKCYLVFTGASNGRASTVAGVWNAYQQDYAGKNFQDQTYFYQTGTKTVWGTESTLQGNVGVLESALTFSDITGAGNTTAGYGLYIVNKDATKAIFIDGVKANNGALAFNTTVSDASWKTIPEPTSALLMLLGMAGLALKRKQA